MVRGLYTSGWSMRAIQKKMDIVTNNMANSSTSGYKKDTLVLESFPDVMAKILRDTDVASGRPYDIGTMALGSDVGEVFTNYSQGQLNSTENKLDMAIRDSSNAFFTVAVPNAEGEVSVFYTRDGSFARSGNNTLVTKEGYTVLGENGPIILESGDFTVGEDGTIIQDGEIIDRLLITEFADTSSLRKFGMNLIQADPDAEVVEFSGSVRQGYIELSNVNIVREMVDMITALRSYEANQKVLQSIDQTLDKAVNQVGSVS